MRAARAWAAGLLGCTILGAATPLLAADDLATVTVTATRIASNSFDVPAAITSVPAQQLQDDALGINLADDIATVPGLLARNRNNYAQDQQISIRGIGANSTFGIRGVRIYQDGIPQTGADGQGQVSQFNLDSAARVEDAARSLLGALRQLLRRGDPDLHRRWHRARPAAHRGRLRQLRSLARRPGCLGCRRQVQLTTPTSRISRSTVTARTAVPTTNPSTPSSATRSNEHNQLSLILNVVVAPGRPGSRSG